MLLKLVINILVKKDKMDIRKIIESLKEIENSYKPILKDAYEIADYIQKTSQQDVDYGLIVDFFMGTKAILKEVPIDSISPDKNQEHHIKSKKKNKTIQINDNKSTTNCC